MFYYGSVAEGLACLEASDEDWADYAGRVCGAAAERDAEDPAP